MLGCGLVERLGAVTTLCMLDEDTVCKPAAAIKEVFLVDAKVSFGIVRGDRPLLDCHLYNMRVTATATGVAGSPRRIARDVRRVVLVLLWMQDDAGSGSGTVLDMHTQQGKKGVRFEDPQWWTHLPSLKPVGLACLLGEAKHSEVLARPHLRFHWRCALP